MESSSVDIPSSMSIGSVRTIGSSSMSIGSGTIDLSSSSTKRAFPFPFVVERRIGSTTPVATSFPFPFDGLVDEEPCAADEGDFTGERVVLFALLDEDKLVDGITEELLEHSFMF